MTYMTPIASEEQAADTSSRSSSVVDFTLGCFFGCGMKKKLGNHQALITEPYGRENVKNKFNA